MYCVFGLHALRICGRGMERFQNESQQGQHRTQEKGHVDVIVQLVRDPRFLSFRP